MIAERSQGTAACGAHPRRVVFLLLMTLFLVFGSAFSGWTQSAEPSLEQILKNARNRLDSLKDVTLTVDAEQADPVAGTQILTVAAVMASPELGLMRMEVVQPAVLEGQLTVLDQNAKTMSIYSPLTVQIVVRKFTPADAQAIFGADIFDMVGLPRKLEDFEFKLIRKEKLDKDFHYLVQVRSRKNKDDDVRRLWISEKDWFISKMDFATPKGKVWLTLKFRDVKLNPGLKRSVLVAMPAGVPVIRP
ncbi:MAG: outer membrane lipoprotein-sorting protein [Firmicutes bacterium]|nr:outer membrane lipoprotein-sorting protein [Bacillota bacterium]